jgi:hypothetical protein
MCEPMKPAPPVTTTRILRYPFTFRILSPAEERTGFFDPGVKARAARLKSRETLRRLAINSE